MRVKSGRCIRDREISLCSVYFPKVPENEIEEELLNLLFAQNEGPHTCLWKVFRSEAEGKDFVM